MKMIYEKIWQLAKPYYKKGRVYDINQIEWMTKEAMRISESIDINKNLLLPLIILHDVGYSLVKNKNPYIKDKESKELHMKEGAKIAKNILKKIDYDPNLSKKIIYYVSVHDNWLFGDNSPFKECQEMALFNDLDFLWVTSSDYAFSISGQSMGLLPEEFYKFWEKDEKLINRPFCCLETKKIFEKSMKNIKKNIEVLEKKNEYKVGKNNIEVRKCVDSDYRFCANLAKINMSKYLGSWLPGKFKKDFDKKEIKIIKHKKHRIGFYHLEFMENSPYSYLKNIQLSKTHRGKGIGTFLMSLIEKETRRNVLDRIRFKVFKKNPAKNFYLKLGYKKIKDEDNLIMLEKTFS